MNTTNDQMQNIKKSYENVVKSVKGFIRFIENKSRKTSNINNYSKFMIQTVSKLYQELYDICPELEKQYPDIKNGKDLNKVLTTLYETTTIPKLQPFLFLLNLLKVVFTTFISEIEKYTQILMTKELIENFTSLEEDSLFEYDELS